MKKAIGMFVALILALGMTGVAFAHWSQIIYIEGSVETGTVSVGWVGFENSDNEWFGKDVGSVAVSLKDVKGTHNGDNIYETLVIQLNNVYPSYEAYIEVKIANGGTIPVNLVHFDIENIVDTENLLDYVYIDIENCDWPDFPQIDPCQTVSATIYIHIEQGTEPSLCPQGATATFAGYLVFDQWNA